MGEPLITLDLVSIVRGGHVVLRHFVFMRFLIGLFQLTMFVTFFYRHRMNVKSILSGVRLLCQRFDMLGLCRPHCF